MNYYIVHADIGSGELYIDAEDAQEALQKAIAQWLANAEQIIMDATFEVRRNDV